MSSGNEHSFWKSKVPHLPGCIKPLNPRDRLLKRSLSLKNEFTIETELKDTLPFKLSLERVNETALEVIKSHNEENGHKNIKLIEEALSYDSKALLNGTHHPSKSHFSTSNAKIDNNNAIGLSKQFESVFKFDKKAAQNDDVYTNNHHLSSNNTSTYKPIDLPPQDKQLYDTLLFPTFTNHATESTVSSTSPSSSSITSSNNIIKPTNIPANQTFPSTSLKTALNTTLPSIPTTHLPTPTTLSSNPTTHPSTLTTTHILPSSSFPGRSIRSNPRRKNFSNIKNDTPSRISKYLLSPDLQLGDLKRMCWSGVPHQSRSLAWKLLSSYAPLNADKRSVTLERKRMEYGNMVNKYYDDEICRKTHHEAYHQIHIDIPRMSPCIPLFQQLLVQQIFERVLFIWAIRHPASGYVQGINDLLTPFFVVFLTPYVSDGADLQSFMVEGLGAKVVGEVEADSFWCFSRLLDGIQDNYTFAQPGIQKQVNVLKELMSRINNPLHHHLISNNIEYLQFAFRWMNNLLMRELPLLCCVRLWDTYLCEPDGFASFHLYVCATLLNRFSQELLAEHDFQGLMLFLKSLPTDNWNDADVGLLLADAYRLKYAFADAPNHLPDS